jgi:hypothetical protein
MKTNKELENRNREITKQINKSIRETKIDTNNVSDGYHTFGELYAHRIQLYITLCKLIKYSNLPDVVWKSKRNGEGEYQKGWFILGINNKPGKQITYHLPNKYWKQTEFAIEYKQAPEYDGHDSNDTLKRLKKIIK